MILRFLPETSLGERAAVERTLRDAGIRVLPEAGALHLRDTPTVEVLQRLAELPGVAEIGPGQRGYTTVRVAALGWLSAASAILGVLVLIAASFPAPLGTPADPLRTPETLRSSWPLLPVHGLVEIHPAWLPVSLLPALALVLVVFWPVFGKGFARRLPRAHAALGVLGLGTAIGLALVEVLG